MKFIGKILLTLGFSISLAQLHPSPPLIIDQAISILPITIPMFFLGFIITLKGKTMNRILVESTLISILIFSWLFLYMPPLNKILSNENVKPNNSTSLTVASINLYEANNQIEEGIKVIKNLNADIIVFQELNNEWHEKLSTITDYPYYYGIPEKNAFGVGVLSKQEPLHKIDSFFAVNIQKAIVLEYLIDNQKVNIVTAHLNPPIDQIKFDIRNQGLERIHDKTQTCYNCNWIISGDLNVSLWSPYYKNMISKSKFKSVRDKSGVYPTWPSMLPIAPIDHILYKGDITHSDTDTFSFPGSDHRGIIATLHIHKGKK